MEQERSASLSLEPDFIQLASSHSDNINVDLNRAHIFIFEDEQLPPCVAIDHKREDWQTTELLFIKEIKVYDTLGKLGVKTVRWPVPHEVHIDSYTDPKNDSEEAEWAVSIPNDKTRKLEGEQETTEEWITLPKIEEEPFSVLKINEQDRVPLTYANSFVIEVGSDDSMDQLVVNWAKSPSEKFTITMYMDDIEDESILDACDSEYMRRMYHPRPTEEMVNDFYQRQIGDRFEVNSELELLHEGYFDFEDDDGV